MAHHGNTPAAWSAVALALVGFTVGSIGLILEPVSWVVFVVGAVVVAAAAVLFIVLSRMGYNA